MLVLSRRRLESIQIGDGIRITIVDIDRNQVRLGIEAPAKVPILREELLFEDRENSGATVATSRARTLARAAS